jgi:hypothetical protein
MNNKQTYVGLRLVITIYRLFFHLISFSCNVTERKIKPQQQTQFELLRVEAIVSIVVERHTEA